MSIQGNLSIINQICQNSGLTGPALDSLRTRLENLSEEQLRVELASSRRDLDKGVTVEIAEEKIEQASGFEEKVISTTDESGNVTETIVTLHAGKPLKMVKKVNGNKVETTTYTYHDATEESAAYVTLETEKSNQSKVTTNVLEVDENGTYAQEDFVDRTTVSMSGEKQYVYTVDNLLYEQVTLAGGGGERSLTVYNGSDLASLDAGGLNRLFQRVGQSEVLYDGNGNTITHAANNDSIERLKKKFNMTTAELLSLNKGIDKTLIAGQQIVVKGERNADSPEILKQGTRQEALSNYNKYVAVPQRIREQYSNISDTIYAELKKSFKPSKENHVFYSRFNQLSADEQRNALNIIKYCKSQNITDADKIKAEILKFYPEINLFDSGKSLPMYSMNDRTPHWQRQDNGSVVSIETFIKDILKLDIKSGEGKAIYERMIQLPAEQLEKISAAGFKNFSGEKNFKTVADIFSSVGVNIRTRDEVQAIANSPREVQRRQSREKRQMVAQNLSIAVDSAIQQLKAYQDNQGWLNVGFYREQLGKLLDKVNPTNVACCMDTVIKQLEEEKKFIQTKLSLASDNPAEFAAVFKEITGKEYDEAKMDKLFELVEKDGSNWTEAHDKAYNDAYGTRYLDWALSKTNYLSYTDGAGDIVLMLLGAETIGKGVSVGAGKLLGKNGLKAVQTSKAARVAFASGVGGTTLATWTAASGTVNNLTKTAQTTSDDWKMLAQATVESFGFGAFGGFLNETVVAKVVKTIDKPLPRMTKAVEDGFKTSKTMTGSEVLQTAIKAENSVSWLAKGAGFLTEVAGFTGYEMALDVVKDICDPKTGHLPEDMTFESLTEYLGEKFAGQVKMLGEIKGISALLMMHKGGKVAQQAFVDKMIAESKNLSGLKFKKVDINGRELYEVTFPDGNRRVATSSEQAIAISQMAMNMEFAANVNGPQGLTTEEDVLVQQAREENPADVVAGKVKREWQRADVNTGVPEAEQPLIIADKDGRARLNLPEVEEPLPVVNDEVTGLIIKGKLNETLTRRYDDMGKVFNAIISENSAEIKKLASECKNDKQKFADGVIKILAKNFGLEGFEPEIKFADNMKGGAADWYNGIILIDKSVTNAKKLTELISHEFVHMLQLRDVIAQYGEQGVREMIMNDNSIPAADKEAKIKSTLTNPYNKHLLESYDVQRAETGSLNDYVRRVYKEEFTNTKSPDDNMEAYTNQAIEREAYNLGSNQLGRNVRGVEDIEIEKKDWEVETREVHEGFVVNEDGSITMLPAGLSSADGKILPKEEYLDVLCDFLVKGNNGSDNFTAEDIANFKSGEASEALFESYKKTPDLYKELLEQDVNGKFIWADRGRYGALLDVIDGCLSDKLTPQDALSMMKEGKSQYKYIEAKLAGFDIKAEDFGIDKRKADIIDMLVDDGTINLDWDSTINNAVKNLAKVKSDGDFDFVSKLTNDLQLSFHSAVNVVENLKSETQRNTFINLYPEIANDSLGYSEVANLSVILEIPGVKNRLDNILKMENSDAKRNELSLLARSTWTSPKEIELLTKYKLFECEKLSLNNIMRLITYTEAGYLEKAAQRNLLEDAEISGEMTVKLSEYDDARYAVYKNLQEINGLDKISAFNVCQYSYQLTDTYKEYGFDKFTHLKTVEDWKAISNLSGSALEFFKEHVEEFSQKQHLTGEDISTLCKASQFEWQNIVNRGLLENEHLNADQMVVLAGFDNERYGKICERGLDSCVADATLWDFGRLLNEHESVQQRYFELMKNPPEGLKNAGVNFRNVYTLSRLHASRADEIVKFLEKNKTLSIPEVNDMLNKADASLYYYPEIKDKMLEFAGLEVFSAQGQKPLSGFEIESLIELYKGGKDYSFVLEKTLELLTSDVRNSHENVKRLKAKEAEKLAFFIDKGEADNTQEARNTLVQELMYIQGRGANQLDGDQIVQIAENLKTPENLEHFKNILFSPERQAAGAYQLSGNDIINLSTLPPEQLNKVKQYIYIENRDAVNQFTGKQIVEIASFNDFELGQLERLLNNKNVSKLHCSYLTDFARLTPEKFESVFVNLERGLTPASIHSFAMASDPKIEEKFDKAIAEAKAKRNQLKSGLNDLTDEDIDKFFAENAVSIIATIDMLGLPTFTHSFTSKLDGVERLVQTVKSLKESLTKESFAHLKQNLLDKSIEPQDKIAKLQTIGALSRYSSIEELTGYIDLIKPNTPTKAETKLAKEIWANPKARFDDKFALFCETFGIDPSNKKVIDFFEKRATVNAKGYKILNSVKENEIAKLLEIEVIRKRNMREWNNALDRKVFAAINVEYSPELSAKLHLADNKYLEQILSSDSSFKDNFGELVDQLVAHPDLSVRDALNLMPQNIETRRQFEQFGIDYDRWVDVDLNSYRSIEVATNAEKTKQAAIENLEADFNDPAFRAIPAPELEKIFDALDNLGVRLITKSEPQYDSDGFVTGYKDVSRLYEDGQPIAFNRLPKVISVIKKVMNENDFWTTTADDAVLNQNRETVYNHIMKLRDAEIDNASKLKDDEVTAIEVHKTDMNDISHSLFLGNHGACCTAVGSGCNQFAAPRYVMDKCISAIEVMDGKEFVGNSMCYFATVDGELAFVLDNIELNGKYQYNDKIRDAFMDYAKQLCEEVGKPDLPIYAGPYRHKLNMTPYETAVRDITIIGSTGGDATYIDFVTGHYVIDGQRTDKVNLFKIR